jgi:hypothetical protein
MLLRLVLASKIAHVTGRAARMPLRPLQARTVTPLCLASYTPCWLPATPPHRLSLALDAGAVLPALLADEPHAVAGLRAEGVEGQGTKA